MNQYDRENLEGAVEYLRSAQMMIEDATANLLSLGSEYARELDLLAGVQMTLDQVIEDIDD